MVKENNIAQSGIDSNLALTDPANMAFFASTSALSYLKPEEIEATFPFQKQPEQRDKTKTVWTSTDGRVLEHYDYGHTSQIYLLKDYNTGHVYVIPRGTEPTKLGDIATDLHPGIDTEGRHQGFANALMEEDSRNADERKALVEQTKEGLASQKSSLEKMLVMLSGFIPKLIAEDWQRAQDLVNREMSVLNKVKGEIRNFSNLYSARNDGEEAHVYLTGHSLGGVTSELIAVDMRQSNMRVDGVVTFGQPAPGTENFAQLSNQMLGTRHVRVAARDDIITEVGGHIKQSTRGFYYIDGKIVSDMTPEQWADRYNKPTVLTALADRVDAHGSYSSYEATALALAQQQRAFIDTNGDAITDHFKTHGLNEDSLRDTPFNPQLSTVARLLHERRSELLASGISEQEFSRFFESTKQQATLHPEYNVRDSAERAKNVPSPYAFSNLRDEYSTKDPYDIISKLNRASQSIAGDNITGLNAERMLRNVAATVGELQADVIADFRGAMRNSGSLDPFVALGVGPNKPEENSGKDFVISHAIVTMMAGVVSPYRGLEALVKGLRTVPNDKDNLPPDIQAELSRAQALPATLSPSSVQIPGGDIHASTNKGDGIKI